MKKFTSMLMLAAASWGLAQAQTQITPSQAQQMYSTNRPSRVVVHDPSVVYDPASSQYYIFGSHRAQAKSGDLYNWTAISPAIPWGRVSNGRVYEVANANAFLSQRVKSVTKNGTSHTLPTFNAMNWSAATSTNYNIDGNLWAPDIIYNKTMKKWCQYLSINGDKWASSIVLLTADNIEGPYVYEGPVVISGFNGTNSNDYKQTDLEIVLGTQSSLPARYQKGSSWGTFWPNNIDPCVFYDEQDNLWMTYGSWSGGIFALQLDEATGLRDYDVEYPLTASGSTYSSDPYFGKKIAGGYYVSGEASYIQHIGDYYYLFMTYGGLASDGGYMMEVFRSKNPDGPYVDPRGTNAIFSSYVMNYGSSGATRGEKILGAYGDWGFMTQGTRAELSQGHNSAITDDQGRSFLVYHTRFKDGTEGHQVRVHQLFINAKGWLVAAPFEFTGETTTDTDIATKQAYSVSDIVGDYQVVVHKQRMNYASKETVSPSTITLHADGSITGAYTGSWELTEGTSYITVKLGTTPYEGVLVEQTMEPYTIKALAFTGVHSSGSSSTVGTCLWGYKMRDDHALAYAYNNGLPVKNGDIVNSSLDLSMSDAVNVTATWESSAPDVISPTGVYNAAAMTSETMPVDLTVTLTAGNYQLKETISVTARRNNGDFTSGMEAYYPFNSVPATNALNTSERATLSRNGTTTSPTLATDAARSGRVVHTYFGAAGSESYVSMPNPLQGKTLGDGFTVSFWARNVDSNLWDALFSFCNTSTTARLYMTGNCYIGYNNAAGNWIDTNYPTRVTTGYVADSWSLVTFTVSRTGGLKLYINGREKAITDVAGSQNGANIAAISAFNFDEVVSFVAGCPNMYLGYGSYWGSLNAYYDDLLVYSRVLSADDISLLYAAETEGHDFTGIETIQTKPATTAATAVYNLNGQRVGNSLQGLPGGIYIQGGKKYVVK